MDFTTFILILIVSLFVILLQVVIIRWVLKIETIVSLLNDIKSNTAIIPKNTFWMYEMPP